MFKTFINRYSQILAFSGCTVSVGLVIFGRKYIDRYRIYRSIDVHDGKPIFFNDYLNGLLLEVGTKMDISIEDLKRVIVYQTQHTNPIYRGCLNLPVKSFLPKSLIPNAGIGLPVHFHIKHFDETSFEKLVIDGKYIDMAPDSSDGIQFRHQILLSEDAKKFIIARQLFYLRNNCDLISDYATIAAFYVAYQVSFLLNRFYHAVPKMKAPLRLVLYSGIAAIAYVAKRQLFENYMVHVHCEADRAAAVDPRWYLGALEYYEKLIKRNKMMHKMGFEKCFNKLGNELPGYLINDHIVTNHIRLSNLMSPKRVT